MCNNDLLEKLLSILLDVKATMRDTAEPSVSEQLDEAIQDIRWLLENDESETDADQKALVCLGKLFDKLPSILALIKYFFD